MGAHYTLYPSVRPTRRAAELGYALSGVVHDKKVLLNFFQKIVQSRVKPWEATDTHYLPAIFTPSLDQESARNLSRGSRLGKLCSMQGFPKIARAALEATDTHYLPAIFTPSLDQESARNLSRGSRLGKLCSMQGFPKIARAALSVTQSLELRGAARPAYAGVKSFAKAKR